MVTGQSNPMKDNYYFDNAATTWPKPEPVYLAMDDCSRRFAVNPGRASHTLAVEAQMLIQQTRGMLKAFFNFSGPAERVVFSLNATDSLNQLLFGLIRTGDHVISTNAEHNSVLRPLNHLQRDQGVDVTMLGVDNAGQIDLEQLTQSITPSTRLIVVNHGSNVTGTVQDLGAIADVARAHDVVFAVDTAQTAGVLPIDMTAMGIDVLIFTGHKGLFGTMGTGGMLVAEGVELVPSRVGGTGVDSIDSFQPEDYPHRLEAGTLAVPGIAGLHAAQSWFSELGTSDPAVSQDHRTACVAAMQKIHALEIEHLQRIESTLSQLDRVTVLGSPDHTHARVATTSFVVEGLQSSTIGDMLDADFHICVRTGLHCAPLMHRDINPTENGAKTGAVRIAPGFFTESSDVDHLLSALTDICT